MSEATARFGLPFILPAQAQKHVTHNEALQRLDAIVHLLIIDEQAAPVASPTDGSCYLVGTGATESWSSHDGEVALFQDGYWQFIAPVAGWSAWFAADQTFRLFDGSVWSTPALTQNASLSTLGINASADTTNRLSISAPATLLNNAGSGHQLKINKNAAGDTASLLFQTGWSGRAEMGLTGSDAFAIKTSPDGANWFEALRVEPSGAVHLPQRPLVRAAPTGAAITLADDTELGFNTLFSNQGGFSLGTSITAGGQGLVFPLAGYYVVSMTSTASASSDFGLALEKNGSETTLHISGSDTGGSNTTISAAAISYFSAGDQLVFKNTGTATYLPG